MTSAMLFALFLLSALTFYPSSTTAGPVTDMYGNFVTNGGIFHILPHIVGTGGGIERIKTGNETIPLTVVQSPFETSKGLPVRITSFLLPTFLPEGPAIVSFEYIPVGASSLEWTAVEGEPEGTVVKVSGYSNILKGFFYIQRASSPNTFKFLFCTSGASLCGNVGIVRDKAGNRVLVVTQKEAHEFVLEELPSTSAASA